MKILIVSDLHLHTWSVFDIDKGLSMTHRLFEQQEILNQLFDIALEHKVEDVEIIGDIFHSVGSVPVICLNLFAKFLLRLQSSKIPVNITIGNHDLVVRTNPKFFHNVTNIFSHYSDDLSAKNIKIKRVAYSELVDYDKIKGYDLVLLHKTPTGSKYGNYEFTEGVDWKKLAFNNRTVWFGHIHERQKLAENCIVVGSPMHLTFGDTGDRGCYIFDTETSEMQFIKLKYPEFRNVENVEDVDVSDTYNYYKVKHATSVIDKSNVISVPIPNFFEERLKSDNFYDILQDWLKLNSKDDSYLELIKDTVGQSKFCLSKKIFNGKLSEVFITDFMSVGFVSYKIDNGFTLVKGKSESFSSNGAGKSTIFEAIFWCLFGETTKGLTGNDVIRRGQKDAKVSLMLESDKGYYNVIRSRKSGLSLAIFENNTTKDILEGLRESDKQKALEEFLGFDKNIFLASCYFSQENLLSLTNMSDTEKTNAITKLLGFEVYDDLYEAIQYRIKVSEGAKVDFNDCKLKLELKKAMLQGSIGQLDAQLLRIDTEISDCKDEIIGVGKLIAEISESKNKLVVEDCKELFDSTLKELNSFETVISNRITHVESLLEVSNSKLTGIEVEISSLGAKLYNITSQIELKKTDLSNFSKSSIIKCDKCGTILTKENSEACVKEQNREIIKLEECKDEMTVELRNLDSIRKSVGAVISDLLKKKSIFTEKLKKVRLEISELNVEYQSKIIDANSDKVKLDLKLKEATTLFDATQRSIVNLDKKKVELVENKRIFSNDLLVVEVEINAITSEEKALDEEIGKLEFWKIAFSSKGIRTLLLDRFCNEINAFVNNYLASISNGSMSLVIKPTSTIKSGEERNKLGLDIFMKGVQVKYESCSGGEKRRIDISLLLGLNAWVTKHFSLDSSLLGFIVLDEVFSFLDSTAEETIGSLLYNESFNKAIFCISHTDELANYCQNIWTVIKENGVSRLECNG